MRAIFFCFFLIFITFPLFAGTAICNAHVFSAIEDVLFLKSDFKLRSRVDTGASQSSLHAEDLHIIEENGVTYADFYTVDDAGARYKMKEQVFRTAEITNTSGIAEKRYVIQTQINVHGIVLTTQVNLKDRSNMQFKFLVGRNLIKNGGFIVDINADECAFYLQQQNTTS